MKALRFFLLFLAVGLTAVLIADMTFLGTAMSYVREGRMAYGLTMGGRNIGGMTREQAAEAVMQGAKKAISGNALVLKLPGEGKEFSYSAEEIGLEADLDAMLDAAYRTGRSGSSVDNFIDVMKCAINGKEIFAAVRLDEERLKETLARVKKEVDREPTDAYLAFTPTGVAPVDGTTGRRMDTQALAEEVKPRLLGLQLPCRETILLKETEPEVALKDIESIDGVLGSCTTGYIADTGRGDNIEIAAAALNDCIVKPGEELSFNARVGRRSASAGYADAPVIVDGKVEQDIGGGVCQVSSTLYNAVLLAGLTATARTSHFYPSAYLPAGLDATVADGQIDFVFQNTMPHSVLIRAGASGGALTVEIYGHQADLPGEYDLETSIIGPPPTVEVYRVLYQGETAVSREYLYTDVYDVPPEEEEKPEEPAPDPEPDPAPATQEKPTTPATAPPVAPPTQNSGKR